MKLSIEVPEPKTVIEIDQTVVRWIAEQEFGLEFTSIAPEQFEQLTKILQLLTATPQGG